MNKQDLVAIVAEAGEMPKSRAGDVLDALFAAITKSLKKKQEVRLVGFGTFSTSKRKAGKGRNPRTGEEIKIPATTTVRFKAGTGLKDAGNGDLPDRIGCDGPAPQGAGLFHGWCRPCQFIRGWGLARRAKRRNGAGRGA